MADAAAVEQTRKLHIIPSDCPCILLDCEEAFAGLTKQERLYAHYIARASHEGSKICLIQTSHESPVIFALLRLIFRDGVAALQSATAEVGVSEADFKALCVYAAAFFSNMGNYRSFGDTKIVPDLPSEVLDAVVKASPGYTEAVGQLWADCRELMYSLADGVQTLGFNGQGVSTYYSSNCEASDALAVQAVMSKQGISGYNTRLFKKVGAEGGVQYELRVASAESPEPKVIRSENPAVDGWETVTVVYGDYAPIMTRVCEHLEEAAKHAASETQVSMLKSYIASFRTGDIEQHKEGSRHWIRDKGPAVESYIGFIENYRDPHGVRAEWEGFAAVVNKVTSAKFGKLVNQAEALIALLPWPSAYEKDTFLRPDFTSLEVLAFGSSGVPAGINIPNYDDIRQSEGFKNVSLGNMLRAYLAVPKGEQVTFLSPADGELFASTVSDSFDVQVGLHELLGHGSGKLFCEAEDGSFNFDREGTTDPTEDGEPAVGSWYAPGETWDTRFQSMASAYEECRAECVGIYLCTNDDVMGIYGHSGARAEDIKYINWLNMARAGVLALQYYTPGKGWGQAHMWARYTILQVMLQEGGPDFVQIRRGDPDQKSGKGTIVTLDRTKITSVGKDCIGEYLRRLQVYKSTADYDKGRAMFDKYSVVSDEMLSLRDEVIANRKPRRLVVQHVTTLTGDGEDVNLAGFPASAEGVVESVVARFSAEDNEFLELWRQDAAQTRPQGM